MGGNGGMHLYLWWRHLPRQLLPRDTPTQSVWLRAIRQHDNHGTLDHADPGADYLPFTQEDLRHPQRAIALEPWTDTQQAFIDSPAVVRTIRGQHGTGKTNALWQAVTSASPANPLYLSRSIELIQYARQYLTTLLPETASPEFLPFRDFVSLMVDEPVEHRTRQQSLELFEQALRLAHINRRTAGPWLSRVDMLYDELHGHMLGSAVPGAADTRYTDSSHDQPRMARLTKLRYLDRRSAAIGLDSAAAAAVITTAVSEHAEARSAFHAAFADLVEANSAIRRLRTEGAPEALQHVDYIAVDEAQDLTLTQVSAILATAAAIGERASSQPVITIAGDDSQTVQPSGFQWSDLTALVKQAGADTEDHLLVETVRAPARVAQTLNRLNSLYTRVGRDIRPSTRQSSPIDDATTGATIVAAIPPEDIASFTERLTQLADTFIISVAEPPPHWITPELQQHVLTAEQVKGLEQTNVAIIGAAHALDTILRLDQGNRYPQLDAITVRSHIDRLRVAASRTSQNLVFVETPADAQRLAQRLDETPTLSADETIQSVMQDHLDARQVVHAKMDQADQFADRAPTIAWQLAAQASREIDASLNPDDLHDLTIRLHRLYIQLATNFVVNGPEESQPDDLLQRIEEAASTPCQAAHAQALKTLQTWLQNQTNSSQLLHTLATLDRPFRQEILSARPDLPSRLRDVITDMANDPNRAVATADSVHVWVPFLLSDHEDADTIMGSIRDVATTALIKANRVQDAQDLHDRYPPHDPSITASLLIQQNRHLEAYRLLHAIGDAERADLMIPAIMARVTNQAIRLLRSNRGQEAYRIMMDLPESFPRTAQYWCIISSILIKDKKIEPAIQAALQATEIEPDRRYPWKNLMFVTHHTEDETRILAVADAVLRNFPDDALMLTAAATRYAHLGKTQRAIEIYQQALELLPDDDASASDLHGMIANCYTDLFTFPAPLATYGETKQNQDNALLSVIRSDEVAPNNTAALAAIMRMMGHIFNTQNTDRASAHRMQSVIERLGIKRRSRTTRKRPSLPTPGATT